MLEENDEEKLVKVFGWDFFDKLQVKKEQLQLDLSLWTFEVICHEVKNFLMTKKTLFACVQASEKVSYPIKKMPKEKNIIQNQSNHKLLFFKIYEKCLSSGFWTKKFSQSFHSRPVLWAQ